VKFTQTTSGHFKNGSYALLICTRYISLIQTHQRHQLLSSFLHFIVGRKHLVPVPWPCSAACYWLKRSQRVATTFASFFVWPFTWRCSATHMMTDDISAVSFLSLFVILLLLQQSHNENIFQYVYNNSNNNNRPFVTMLLNMWLKGQQMAKIGVYGEICTPIYGNPLNLLLTKCSPNQN